jgi:RNA polymerase sigma-70 factor (ECF subfamily)
MEDSAAEFERLVDSYYRPLFRFGMSLSGSEGAACDLVQQTFYAWAEKGHQLRDRTRAKTWLFTTLYREFIQSIRRQKRLVPFIEEQQEEALTTEPPPEPDFIAGFDPHDLHAALSEIPEDFRVVLTLYYMEEFTYEQLANLLNVPIGTVMSRIHRGKTKLRRKLIAARALSEATTIPFEPQKEARNG